MISICNFVFVILLISFDQNETRKVRRDGQQLLLKSISTEYMEGILDKIISPYGRLTYETQLDMKHNRCRDAVEMILNSSKSTMYPKTYKLLPIVPSPITKAYRNRDLFYIGTGVDGNLKTVGIIVKNISIGKSFSIHPTKIITIKESHKRVAQIYEDFIRLSQLPPHVKENDGGHWGVLLVRSNEAGDVMAAVTVQPKGYTKLKIQEEQQALKEYFHKHLPNITLYHQQCETIQCTHEIAPYILLHGKPYFVETLHGYKFKITPSTFFLINKWSAESLYDTIIKLAKLKPNTAVIDICGSEGPISIVMSKYVKRVIGIECNSKVAMHGRQSVTFNNIHNVHFLCGRPKTKMMVAMNSLNESSDILPIVNPVDGGLGMVVIEAFRQTPQITKLVFITSKLRDRNNIRSIGRLCSFWTSKFPPFRLTKAIPVDLLPHTAYVELILLFQKDPL